MPAKPAAGLAALDALRWQGKILIGDRDAGLKYAWLAARWKRRFYAGAYSDATDILDRSGARRMVDTVVLDGRLPHSPAGLDQFQTGLDALHTHFCSEGLL